MSSLSAELRTRIAELATAGGRADWQSAVADFASAVRRRHGSDVVGIFLFGSRARGDARPDSDVDVAVVFAEAAPEWTRLRDLSGLAFDVMLERGVRIQPHPTTVADWEAGRPAFVGRAKREARRLS